MEKYVVLWVQNLGNRITSSKALAVLWLHISEDTSPKDTKFSMKFSIHQAAPCGGHVGMPFSRSGHLMLPYILHNQELTLHEQESGAARDFCWYTKSSVVVTYLQWLAATNGNVSKLPRFKG